MKVYSERVTRFVAKEGKEEDFYELNNRLINDALNGVEPAIAFLKNVYDSYREKQQFQGVCGMCTIKETKEVFLLLFDVESTGELFEVFFDEKQGKHYINI